MREQVVGVLLAGGASRRFGSPKAFADIDGKRFYQLSLEALQPAVESIIIVTSEQLEKSYTASLGMKIIRDVEKHVGKGPLAGIYSAMLERKADWYAIAPVDVPFIRPAIYYELLNQRESEKEAIISVANGRVQPLIALYHYSLKARIRELLETNRLSMQDLLNLTEVNYIQFIDETPFININRQQDYERYIRDRS